MSSEILIALLVPVALVVGASLGWLARSRVTGSADSVRANARLETQLAESRTRFEEQRQLLADTEAKFREAFQSLAAEALNSNNQAFLNLAKAAMGEVQQQAEAELEKRRVAIDQTVAPVKEALDKFDSAVREIEKERVGAYSDLKAQVAALKTGQQSLQSETNNLVKALRTPTARGKWGEYQLRRVVELAGMVENCDFTEQAHVAAEAGNLRPDVVVHLPGNKTTVIDAKVPLLAYLDAIECDDEQRRRNALAAPRPPAAHPRRASSAASPTGTSSRPAPISS